MNWLESLIHKIGSFFISKKAKDALQLITQIMIIAEPIVTECLTLVPNTKAVGVLAQVFQAYDRFGVPLTATIQEGNADQVGQAMFQLACTVVEKNIPKSFGVVATNLIQSGVQLAISAVKNK